MPAVGAKVIPTQLIEAAFLFALFGLLLWFTLSDKVKGFNLVSYALSYSVFRFVIEFFRDDYRGSFIPGLSPSQFQSIILLAVGVFVVALRLKYPERFVLAPESAPETPEKSDETSEKTDETSEND